MGGVGVSSIPEQAARCGCREPTLTGDGGDPACERCGGRGWYMTAAAWRGPTARAAPDFDPPDDVSVRFFVPGKPQTAGSKSAFVVKGTNRAVVTEAGSAESKARKRTWRADLKDAAARAARLDDDGIWAMSDWALEVRFVVLRKRPAAHLRTGKAAGVVKDWALGLRPTTIPDVLKVARAAEDALTGVLWHDDAQIVDELAQKVYADQVGMPPTSEGLMVVVCRADGRGRSTAEQMGTEPTLWSPPVPEPPR